MSFEARQASSRLSPASGGASHGLQERRAEGFAHHRPAGNLPTEIAFLAAQGVPPGLLLKAAERARDVDVTADRALLGAGFPEDTFYRLLARHLGMPYLEQPMRLVFPPRPGPWDGRPEAAALASNARGLDRVLAPRGANLRDLLDLFQAGQGRGARTAILSPRYLKALIRRQDAPALLHLASHGLASWDETLSARGGLTTGQEAACLGAGLLFALGLIVAPAVALGVLAVTVSLLFLAAVMLRLCATAMSPKAAAPPKERIPDHHLPVYTIVAPLLREATVVPKLVSALSALDYPCAKLDIKLMVEEGDAPTIAAIQAQNLPIHFDTIMAPRGFPRTKPRALNIGLAYAQGEFLVVYDAEDRPDPGQLRDAVALFRTRRMRTACLQARLAIDHGDETWLARLFAMDYAGLFDVVMPGLAAMRLPIPLGGTSNHFRVEILRRIGGWDSYNVTEDIDLGFRLARFGYRVEALDSTTFEEAPLRLQDWLPQRTRWLKGWMVTLVVVTRRPRRLLRDLGIRGTLSVTAALFGTILGCLFGPIFFCVASAQMVWGSWLSPKTPAQALLSAASCFLLLAGIVSALWPVGLGLKRRGRLDLLPWLVTLPAYLGLVSLAAWRALHEAVTDPQRWNKTEHGLATERGTAGGRAAGG